MKKVFLSFALILLLASAVSLCVLASETQNIGASSNVGDPTVLDPADYPTTNWIDYAVEPTLNGMTYEIYTAAELAWVAKQTVYLEDTFEGKTIKLMTNIDLNDHLWTPIGNANCNFDGTLDGNGKKISNMVITGDIPCAGLIGYAYYSTVTDLSVYNATVDIESSNSVFAGAICGDGYITISNCTVDSCSITASLSSFSAFVGGAAGEAHNVTNSTITNCSITASGNYFVGAGGASGSGSVTNSTITNCSITASSSYTYAGGASGLNGNVTKSIITNCSITASGSSPFISSYAGGASGSGNATSSIVKYTDIILKSNNGFCGGITGNGVATNCAAIGVTITDNYDGTASNVVFGGVVGDTSGAVKNCYTDIDFFGNYTTAGAVCGKNSGTVINCYYNSDKLKNINTVGSGNTALNCFGMTAADMKKAAFADTLNNCWDSDEEAGNRMWALDSESGFPILKLPKITLVNITPPSYRGEGAKVTITGENLDGHIVVARYNYSSNNYTFENNVVIIPISQYSWTLSGGVYTYTLYAFDITVDGIVYHTENARTFTLPDGDGVTPTVTSISFDNTTLTSAGGIVTLTLNGENLSSCVEAVKVTAQSAANTITAMAEKNGSSYKCRIALPDNLEYSSQTYTFRVSIGNTSQTITGGNTVTVTTAAPVSDDLNGDGKVNILDLITFSKRLLG